MMTIAYYAAFYLFYAPCAGTGGATGAEAEAVQEADGGR
jgi:hypothetical protein